MENEGKFGLLNGMTSGKGFAPQENKGTTYRKLFEQLLKEAGKGNRKKLYRLFAENQDKLNDNFAQVVRKDAELKLENSKGRQRGILVSKLFGFSYFIDDFPRGNRAIEPLPRIQFVGFRHQAEIAGTACLTSPTPRVELPTLLIMIVCLQSRINQTSNAA
ncbi:MAG: hypothetical protein F6K58_27285 [Symploca sp. SIO2E9]|nr:hypothetical protein [Symploca sp. SIO2E9]